MLILASVSGIQSFLFDVRESGGGQARSLRHRSFRIQIIAECVAIRLLHAAGLERDRLLFCAAAKVAIDASGSTPEAIEAAHGAADEMAELLLRETHGRLRLTVVMRPTSGSFASDFSRVEHALRRAKLRPYAQRSGTGWDDGQLVVKELWDAEREAERDAVVGRDLVNARWLTIARSRDPGDGLDVLGLRVHLSSNEPTPSPALLSCSNLAAPEAAPAAIDRRLFHVRRLARHVPRDTHGQPIEFVELAARSRGAAMLGVLKADADSLGAAIAAALQASAGPEPLTKLSSALDHFFADTLETEKHAPARPWRFVYTVFSGGDDLLAVGPWNVVLDFAGRMCALFHGAFGGATRNSPSPLTISAGIAIIKARYPIHLAALQADDLLGQAKSEPAPGAAAPKDQCAAFGQVWKWADHDRIVSTGKRLADWVDRGVIQPGWLHTLLELARLRRGQAGPEHAGVHTAVATSRLAYHVSRNWPRRDAGNDSARAARQWIDSVIEHFDADLAGAPVDVRDLPVVVRYAILATRAVGRED